MSDYEGWGNWIAYKGNKYHVSVYPYSKRIKLCFIGRAVHYFGTTGIEETQLFSRVLEDEAESYFMNKPQVIEYCLAVIERSVIGCIVDGKFDCTKYFGFKR